MLQLLFSLLFFLPAHARDADKPQNGMIEIRKGHSLYVEYKPAQNGKPTLFLLNGLTYSTSDWRAFKNALLHLDSDIGIVAYDMEGMGQTLMQKLPPNYDIPFANQIQDLYDLVLALDIKGPISAMGLSYGGGVGIKFAAEHPGIFDQVIAFAPYIERLPDQDRTILQLVANHRRVNPWDKSSDDQLYDFYLHSLIMWYPLVEPGIASPFRVEGVYQMVRGAKSWNAADVIGNLPKGQVHIVGSRADEYVTIDRLLHFLDAVPEGILPSTLLIEDSTAFPLLPMQKYHKIPELHPALSAKWVQIILNKDPDLQKGLRFTVKPHKGPARSGTIGIPLGDANACTALLGKPRATR